MPISLEDLPEPAVTSALDFRDELLEILGGDLVAMWMHGGTTFPDRSLVPGDIDLAVVISGLTDEEQHAPTWRADTSSRAYKTVAAQKASGAGLDVTYMLVGPRGLIASAFYVRRQGKPSPVDRAHWLAGQYALLHGRFPEELVIPPTEDELTLAADREIEHLERHVYEGDANNPYEATYAIWNGCRVLYTLATGSPVISKRSAGAWGLEHLPEEWHPAIHAAGRSYDGLASNEDKAVLRDTMAPFVEMIRQRLPRAEDREGAPRWSGE